MKSENKLYLYIPGPTLESKGTHGIFQKKGKKNVKKGQKRAKYVKVWAKMYKI